MLHEEADCSERRSEREGKRERGSERGGERESGGRERGARERGSGRGGRERGGARGVVRKRKTKRKVGAQGVGAWHVSYVCAPEVNTEGIHGGTMKGIFLVPSCVSSLSLHAYLICLHALSYLPLP
jgi:hypothetical protein